MLRSFFFTPTPPTEIYTLSLHDALPIWGVGCQSRRWPCPHGLEGRLGRCGDRKSTRLNSSHLGISYAVFCLKKKKRNEDVTTRSVGHGRLRQSRGRARGHLTRQTARARI